MLKQYVERQNVTSYRSAFVDAICNVKDENTNDPVVHWVTEDKVTSDDVMQRDITHGNIRSR